MATRHYRASKRRSMAVGGIAESLKPSVPDSAATVRMDATVEVQHHSTGAGCPAKERAHEDSEDSGPDPAAQRQEESGVGVAGTGHCWDSNGAVYSAANT